MEAHAQTSMSSPSFCAELASDSAHVSSISKTPQFLAHRYLKVKMSNLELNLPLHTYSSMFILYLGSCHQHHPGYKALEI